MKTATVTWITYNNYGTMLQAYALQKYLVEHGAENEIVSDYFIVNKDLSSDPTPPKESAWIQYLIHPMRLVFKIIYAMQDYSRRRTIRPYLQSQDKFAGFKEKDLKILHGLKRQDMHSLNDQFDIFLCGSDQIWSVLDCNFDGYFYLDFVSKKKVAYAPSIGTDRISNDKEQILKEYLKDFSGLSVREKQSAQYLTEKLERQVEWVSDPTLLYDQMFWLDFTKNIKKRKKKYLLCYFLGKSEWYFEYAEKMAGYLDLEVLLIPTWAETSKNKATVKGGVGPREFVALFRDAAYVLTDSYHGSIFAMQFQKEFVHLKRFRDDDPICQNIRVNSLFSYLGLEDTIVCEKEFCKDDIYDIAYDTVNKKLGDFRQKSQEYINKNVLE